MALAGTMAATTSEKARIKLRMALSFQDVDQTAVPFNKYKKSTWVADDRRSIGRSCHILVIVE